MLDNAAKYALVTTGPPCSRCITGCVVLSQYYQAEGASLLSLVGLRPSACIHIAKGIFLRCDRWHAGSVRTLAVSARLPAATIPFKNFGSFPLAGTLWTQLADMGGLQHAVKLLEGSRPMLDAPVGCSHAKGFPFV